MNAQTNAPNPDFKPALFHELYEAVDVSRYVPAKADGTRLNDWRRKMNAALRN